MRMHGTQRNAATHPIRLRRRAFRAGGLLGAAAALAAAIFAGCSSHESPASAGAKPSPAAPLRKARPASLIPPDMVMAVSGTHAGPSVVQVKFELRERPQVASPLEIDLVIVPVAANVDRVFGTIEAGAGLELADGAQIPPADRPAEGIPIAHSVKVLAKREGIFTVTATLTVDAAGVSSSQTFAIPVIVGGTPPESAGKPAASTTAGGGKPTPAPR
jgi:hypothetical protein